MINFKTIDYSRNNNMSWLTGELQTLFNNLARTSDQGKKHSVYKQIAKYTNNN